MNPYEKQETIFIARLDDIARQCDYPYYFDFLDPHHQMLATTYLKNKPLSYLLWGGYTDAERKMLCIYPDYIREKDLRWPLRLCKIPIKFSCSHRDVLGSLMALGIERDCIGDIFIDKNSVQFLFVERLESFIDLSLTELRGNDIQKKFVEDSELTPIEIKTKNMRIVAASMRADGVISKIWGLSRAEAQRAVKQQRLKINGKPVIKETYALNLGDIISLRGKGKACVTGVEGKTKKGNTVLIVEKYI